MRAAEDRPSFAPAQKKRYRHAKMRVIFMPFWGENAMKVIEYGEKSCQGMLLTSPKKRKTWRKAVSYFCSQVGRKK